MIINNSILKLIDMDTSGINYLHAKFQINIFKNKKVIKLLELWQLWLKKRKENSEYESFVIQH